MAAGVWAGAVWAGGVWAAAGSVTAAAAIMTEKRRRFIGKGAYVFDDGKFVSAAWGVLSTGCPIITSCGAIAPKEWRTGIWVASCGGIGHRAK